MVVDLKHFIESNRPVWTELEKLVDRLESDPGAKLTLAELQRFHFLYESTAADLARIKTFSAEPEIRRYLESLVARTYGEVHETRDSRHRFRPLLWFFVVWPQTFRRHIMAFWLSVAVTIAGCAFGGFALLLDPGAKPVLLPFEHLQGSPVERVAREEKAVSDRLSGQKTSFSAFLMTHNTQVSIFAMASGMTWGIGTILLLFYNGVILGAVVTDYVSAGQAKFLVGWLLPHGAIEIPAILIAGQAGLMLAGALLGRGRRQPLSTRLRTISPDLVTLIGGVALMLVWAGIVEGFLSQYHEPIIPYAVKIAFGCVELLLLALFLARSGLQKPLSQTRKSLSLAQHGEHAGPRANQ